MNRAHGHDFSMRVVRRKTDTLDDFPFDVFEPVNPSSRRFTSEHP
jgi:hypothetical protein